MSFFKKLKDRLFTLNLDDDIKKEVKPNKEKQTYDKEISENEIILKKENKLEKKIEKEIFQKQKKQNKIDKYVAGLDKSGSSFSRRIKEIQSRHNQINDDFFDDLEEMLIMSDISMSLVMDIIHGIKKEVQIENVTDPKLISEIVADKMFAVYANKDVLSTELNIEDGRKNIILVVGVNGAGKTTTIAKLANKYIQEGKKVLVAAGDTFRAGAVEQLNVWTDRIGAHIVKAKKEGADPASVVFEALAQLKTNNYDLLIIDTAGRLQNKVNLMNELGKINKIIQREFPDAPHESLLVLDATTGQNGVSQAKNFKDVTPLSGIVLTKMDGTSKGGIVLTIKDQLELSVKLIGLGEGLDDLQEFDLDSFIFGMTQGLMED